ncbi:cytochrome P450 [Armillaria luteobubalina]|uniref:Cytochrome P450 n=1 Tax=Armillaria luteobubalina TaxID=153913 RepID=A0AA39NZL2_9AGAR|nr:cytochrome P450 [Armillaria luteobubalina]
MSTTSIFIGLACTFILAIIVDVIITYAQRKQNPPLVRSYLPWIGTGFAFHRTRVPFFSDCRMRYGSYYRFNLGPMKSMVVVSSRRMLKRFFIDKRFDNKDAHFRTLSALGSRLDRAHLSIPIHKHFLPSMGCRLSNRVVVKEFLSSLCFELGDGLGNLSEYNLLSDVIGKVLYNAINAVLFGPSFPPDTYTDFLTLDRAMPALLSGFHFMLLPSIFARRRLLWKMMSYIQENHSNDGKARVSVLPAALKSVEQRLPLHEQAVCMLSLLWVVHTNIRRSTFWLTAYVLANADVQGCLRAEIDTTLEKLCPGDSDATLLYNDPDSISANFPLVVSAVTESLRLCMLPASLRIASIDIEFQADNRPIFVVRRGEMMMGNVTSHHHDDEVYPEASTFKVDRSFSSDLARPPKIMTWGDGVHICKGHFFVQHIMKLWLIMLLQKYDCRSPITSVPGIDPSSWNTIAEPISDVPVFLFRRGKNSVGRQ